MKDIGYTNLDDANRRITTLELQLAMLRLAADLYMDEAWHHEDCPSYRGDTFEHCTCGYTALKEQDKCSSR